MDKILEKWEEILQYVKKEHELSDISFDTWLKPLEVYSVEENLILHSRPVRADWNQVT